MANVLAKLLVLIALSVSAVPAMAARPTPPATARRLVHPSALILPRRPGLIAPRGVDFLADSKAVLAAPPANATEAFTAVKAVIKSMGIVPFMEAMALGHTVQPKGGGSPVNLALLKVAWQDKTSSQGIEDIFRAYRPGDHEWIPSDKMVDVIDRAQSTGDLSWIHLQDLMRTPTANIIFKPTVPGAQPALPGTTTVAGKVVVTLSGHVGAIKGSLKGSKIENLTDGMEDFHNELRKKGFNNSDSLTTINAQTLTGNATAVGAVANAWMIPADKTLFSAHPLNPTIVPERGGAPLASNVTQSLATFGFSAAGVSKMLSTVVADAQAAAKADNTPELAKQLAQAKVEQDALHVQLKAQMAAKK